MDNYELKVIFSILPCFYCTFGPDFLSGTKKSFPTQSSRTPGFLSGLRSFRIKIYLFFI